MSAICLQPVGKSVIAQAECDDSKYFWENSVCIGESKTVRRTDLKHLHRGGIGQYLISAEKGYKGRTKPRLKQFCLIGGAKSEETPGD